VQAIFSAPEPRVTRRDHFDSQGQRNESESHHRRQGWCPGRVPRRPSWRGNKFRHGRKLRHHRRLRESGMQGIRVDVL